MVATDTVVGVAGAILLAAVMVGVFVYEYNNGPATVMGAGKGPSDADKRTTFAAAYPLLGASDDLDGDHNPNFNDTDMDGNLVSDANQAGDLLVRGQFGGQTATPPATTTQVHLLVIGKGDQHLHAELNYTVTIPLPGAPRVPVLELVLLGPDGSTAAQTQTATQNGGNVNERIDSGALPAGNYTLKLNQTQAGPSEQYDVNFALDYGLAKPKV